jgi:hypothetical protein
MKVKTLKINCNDILIDDLKTHVDDKLHDILDDFKTQTSCGLTNLSNIETHEEIVSFLQRQPDEKLNKYNLIKKFINKYEINDEIYNRMLKCSNIDKALLVLESKEKELIYKQQNYTKQYELYEKKLKKDFDIKNENTLHDLCKTHEEVVTDLKERIAIVLEKKKNVENYEAKYEARMVEINQKMNTIQNQVEA